MNKSSWCHVDDRFRLRPGVANSNLAEGQSIRFKLAAGRIYNYSVNQNVKQHRKVLKNAFC